MTAKPPPLRPWEKGITEEQRALDAPIIVGREYEGVVSPIDGHVFTGRTDYYRYCKEKNLTPAADYDKPGGTWDKAAEARKTAFTSPEAKRARQDVIGRRLYEVEKMPQAKYEREVKRAEILRRERTELAEKAK